MRTTKTTTKKKKNSHITRAVLYLTMTICSCFGDTLYIGDSSYYLEWNWEEQIVVDENQAALIETIDNRENNREYFYCQGMVVIANLSWSQVIQGQIRVNFPVDNYPVSKVEAYLNEGVTHKLISADKDRQLAVNVSVPIDGRNYKIRYFNIWVYYASFAEVIEGFGTRYDYADFFSVAERFATRGY